MLFVLTSLTSKGMLMNPISNNSNESDNTNFTSTALESQTVHNRSVTDLSNATEYEKRI